MAVIVTCEPEEGRGAEGREGWRALHLSITSPQVFWPHRFAGPGLFGAVSVGYGSLSLYLSVSRKEGRVEREGRDGGPFFQAFGAHRLSGRDLFGGAAWVKYGSLSLYL